MLFPYKNIEHNISRLQNWIDYLFMNVWCNAKSEYDIELLAGCPELKKIVEEEAWKEDPKKKEIDYLTGPISNIYDLFKTELTWKQRKQIKRWYRRSKNLEKVCENIKFFNPIERKIIKKFSKKLDEEIYSFYKNLFEHVLDLAVIKGRNGTLKNHYDDFIKINNAGICPFCGLSTLRSYEMEGHEAYDHYLPKETYPFYAINFKNLVPCCHDCNSIHKSRNSPIFLNNKKGRAFYPYSKSITKIELEIEVDISNYTDYGHKHIQINVYGERDKDKIQTWFNLYKIEKRYKDELTNDGVGKYWLVEFLEELDEKGRKDEFDRLKKKNENSRFREKNFLKIPFLESCKNAGLF